MTPPAVELGTNDKLVAWVRIPVLDFDNNTTIYMYYGNTAVTAATENPTGVWDSSYVGVWHLKEEQAGTGTADVYKDSTANANHGDDYPMPTMEMIMSLQLDRLEK
jgi:hypothetical protein